MKRFITTAIAIVILAGTAIMSDRADGREIMGAQTGKHAGPGGQRARTVVVEKVRMAREKSHTAYPGTVHAVKTANLAFRVSGPLIKVNVKPGDRVKKGQVLLKIDPQDFKDRIGVLEARLSGAESKLNTANSDFVRMKTLFSQKVIPQADFDHAKNAVDTARAEVKGLNSQLTIARHQLDYSELKAPFDAIITARMIENYEMVSQGRPVVSLHDISMLKIEINLPENEMSGHRLVSGSQARVSFPSLGSQSFDIRLKEWKTSADPTTKTYRLTFIMPEPEQALVLPGMTAEVRWCAHDADRSVMTVPVKAVITDDSGRSALWVLDEKHGTATKVPVTSGEFSGASRIVVESGLSGDEWIVTQGMNFIVQGEKLSRITKLKNE